jgi:adenylate kinase
MTVYIVTGAHGVGKSTVIKGFLKNHPEFKRVTFGDVMFEFAKAENIVDNKDDMRNKIDPQKYRQIQKKAAEKIGGMEGNIVLDTHCSIKMKRGYYPGLPKHVIKVLAPRAIVLIEARPEEIKKRRETDPTRHRSDFGEVEGTVVHQNMNRAYAAAYSMLSGAFIKIIVNEEGNAEEASKKLEEVLL